MSTVSTAKFLTVLDITEVPVFGMAVCSQYCYVSATRFHRKFNVGATADFHAHAYWNLTCEPFSVLPCSRPSLTELMFRRNMGTEEGRSRFKGFMEFVGGHDEKLPAAFVEKLLSLLSKARSAEGLTSLKWTLRSQYEEFGLSGEAEDARLAFTQEAEEWCRSAAAAADNPISALTTTAMARFPLPEANSGSECTGGYGSESDEDGVGGRNNVSGDVEVYEDDEHGDFSDYRYYHYDS